MASGLNMKRIVLATALVALGSASALAADLPPRSYDKAPAMAAPVTNWSGLYIGGNVGYGRGAGGSGAVFPPTDFAFQNASLDTRPKGVVGGGQIGFNWRMGSLVAGFEADIQHSGMNGSSQSPLINLNGTSGIGSSISVEHKLSWFGTVRGRIGVAVTADLLLYGTSGLAYGDVSASQAAAVVNFATSANTNQTKTGWTAGAGAEWMFAHNWSAKVEYLRIDLGGVSTTALDIGVQNPPIFSIVNTKAQYDIVRAGVNYHFN